MSGDSSGGPRVREVGGVLEITLAPYSTRNALDTRACEYLSSVFALHPPPERKCYLIQGEGEAFSSGADLRDLTTDESARAFETALKRLYRQLHEQPLPIVGWINGAAIGGGAILALLCDIRLAAPASRLEIPAMRRGFAVGPDLVRVLDDQLGRLASSRLVILGAEITGAELVTLGYAHLMVADRSEALAVAEAIAAFGGAAVQSNRRALQGRLDDAIALGELAYASPERANTIAGFGSGDRPTLMSRRRDGGATA
jgi:enoyl-CoA hydratase/carnithine racemase